MSVSHASNMPPRNGSQRLSSRPATRAARIVGVVGAVAVAAGLAATAAPANAAVLPASQPSWCGWHPGNTMWNPGDILQAPLNLRTGQSTMCNTINTFQSAGWGYLNIRCYNVNGSGETWYYVDSTLGYGWVYAGDIFGTFDAGPC